MSEIDCNDPNYWKPGKGIGNPVALTYHEFIELLAGRGFGDADQVRTFFGRQHHTPPKYVIHYPFERAHDHANIIPNVSDELLRLRALGLDLFDIFSAPNEIFFATHDEGVRDKLYLVETDFRIVGMVFAIVAHRR